MGIRSAIAVGGLGGDKTSHYCRRGGGGDKISHYCRGGGGGIRPAIAVGEGVGIRPAIAVGGWG